MSKRNQTVPNSPYLTGLNSVSWLAFRSFAARRFINPTLRGVVFLGKFLGVVVGAHAGYAVGVGAVCAIAAVSPPLAFFACVAYGVYNL